MGEEGVKKVQKYADVICEPLWHISIFKMFTFSEEETKKPVAADAAPVVANGKKDDSSDDDSSEG